MQCPLLTSHDDLWCSLVFGNQHVDESNGTGACDEDGLSDLELCATGSFHSYSNGLAEGALLKANMVGKPVKKKEFRSLTRYHVNEKTVSSTLRTVLLEAEVSRVGIESCDVSTVRWSSAEYLVRTQVVPADLAKFTSATPYAGFNGYTVTCNETNYITITHLSTSTPVNSHLR